MSSEYQVFVDGDVGPCGAILRHAESGALRTRTVFKMGDDAPVYLVDHLVEYDSSVHQWTRFTYECPTAEITRREGHRAADGSVHIDGEAVPALDGALPGYGEHLVLTSLLTNGDRAVAYPASHPLQASVVESNAVWVCPVDHSVVAPIGEA